MPRPITTATDLLAVASARQSAGGVDTSTLWRWAKAGIIPPPRKINGRNYWIRGEFEAALLARAKAEISKTICDELGCNVGGAGYEQ